jgi:hypothetical protein
LSSSCAIQKKTQNDDCREAHCCLLQPKKNPQDNDKPLGSSSSSTTQEKLAQDDDELRGLSSCCITQETKTQDNDKLPSSLSFFVTPKKKTTRQR